MMLTSMLANRWVHAAVAGAVAAALIDFNAFRAWKTWQDALTYNWATALFRWFQVALTGLVTAAGFSVVS
jgi:hypothetical protein